MTDNFIGRGEKTTKKILEILFPNATIITQVPISKCVSPEIYSLYDEVYKKATIDIVMEYKNKVFAIRVQDAHHTGGITSRKDAIQRKDMKDNNVTVVDIYERESRNLFLDKFNYKSVLQVILPLKNAGVPI